MQRDTPPMPSCAEQGFFPAQIPASRSAVDVIAMPGLVGAVLVASDSHGMPRVGVLLQPRDVYRLACMISTPCASSRVLMNMAGTVLVGVTCGAEPSASGRMGLQAVIYNDDGLGQLVELTDVARLELVDRLMGSIHLVPARWLSGEPA